MSVNTTPRTWVSGETVTAAEMNAEIRDFAVGVQAAWTAYTPVWSSTGTQPTLGTTTGRYTRFGKTVHFYLETVFSASTTAGTGSYIWTLPVAGIHSGHAAMGVSGVFFDASTTTDFAGWGGVHGSTTTVVLRSTAGAAVGAAVPVVPATGDVISISGTYEAA